MQSVLIVELKFRTILLCTMQMIYSCVPLLQAAFIPAENGAEDDQHTIIFSLKEEKGALRKALTPFEVSKQVYTDRACHECV